MKWLPIFSCIDVLASKKSVPKLKNLGFFGKLEEQPPNLIIDQILGVIK